MRKRRSRFLQIWALLPRPCRSPWVRKRTLRKRRMMRTGLVVMAVRVPGLRVYYPLPRDPAWAANPALAPNGVTSHGNLSVPSTPNTCHIPPPLPYPLNYPDLLWHLLHLDTSQNCPHLLLHGRRTNHPKEVLVLHLLVYWGDHLFWPHPRPIRRQERGHPVGPKAPAAQGKALPFWVQLDEVGLYLLQMIVSRDGQFRAHDTGDEDIENSIAAVIARACADGDGTSDPFAYDSDSDSEGPNPPKLAPIHILSHIKPPQALTGKHPLPPVPPNLNPPNRWTMDDSIDEVIRKANQAQKPIQAPSLSPPEPTYLSSPPDSPPTPPPTSKTSPGTERTCYCYPSEEKNQEGHSDQVEEKRQGATQGEGQRERKEQG